MNFATSNNTLEIVKLANMLAALDGDDMSFGIHRNRIVQGLQLECYIGKDRAFSVVQGEYSDGGRRNLLELCCDETNDVDGCMTAEEVYKIIKDKYEEVNAT